MIKLLFSANKSIFSRAIRMATWSDYSHVDFIFAEDGSDLIARNDYGYPAPYRSPVLLGAIAGRGVCLREMSKVIESSSRYAIAEVAVSETALNYALGQLGKKYDYAALLGFPMRSSIENQDKWFCSELVTWAIEMAGLELFNENTARITPRDLYIHPYVRVLESHSHVG